MTLLGSGGLLNCSSKRWRWRRALIGAGVVWLVVMASTGGAAQAASTGAVSGTVRSNGGAVLPGISVTLSNPVYGNVLGRGVTDGVGRFTIYGLPATNLVVAFDDPTATYAKTWWPGQPSSATATVVAMPNDGAVTVNEQLAAAATISGTVTGSSPASSFAGATAPVSVAGMYVVVAPASAPSLVAYAITDGSGNFQVRALTPGVAYKMAVIDPASISNGNDSFAPAFYNGGGLGRPLDVSQFATAVPVVAPAAGVNTELTYRSTVTAGSPDAAYGNDPDTGLVSNFFLQVASYNTYKYNGDQYTAGSCAYSSFGCGTGTPTNAQYRPEGNTYTVEVTQPGSPLDIQAYDPAAVNVGDFCDRPNGAYGGSRSSVGDPNALLNIVGTQLNQVAGVSDVSAIQNQFGSANIVASPTGAPLDLVHRWGRTDQQPTVPDQTEARSYCNGDWVNNYNPGGPDIKTTYIVRAPDTTPGNDLDNPPICAITFDSYARSGTTGYPAPILNFNVFQKLASPATAAAQGYPAGTGDPNWNNDALSGTERMAFWKHFHQWATLCRVPAAAPGRYIVQVKTDTDLTNPGTTPTTTATPGLNIGTLAQPSLTPTATQVANRYSLRALNATATPGSPAASQGIGPWRLVTG